MSDFTYSTYDVVGEAEDVSDLITRIDPEETPFFSNGNKNKARAVLHQWQVQEFTPRAVNRAKEGADAVAASVTPTTLAGNVCGIAQKTYQTSGTVDAVKKYGRDSEHAYQTMLEAMALRRDIEVTLLANAAQDQQTSSATARVIGGLPTWITNANTAASTVLSAGLGTTAVTFAGTTFSSVAISNYSDAHQKAYEDGGNPNIIMMSPDQKQNFVNLVLGSTVSDVAELRYTQTSKKEGAAIGSVDCYLSPFGLVDIVLNRNMAFSTEYKRQSYLLDTSKYAISTLRPMQTTRLAKTGDNMKSQILWEGTLEMSAPKAHAAVFDQII